MLWFDCCRVAEASYILRSRVKKKKKPEKMMMVPCRVLLLKKLSRYLLKSVPFFFECRTTSRFRWYSWLRLHFTLLPLWVCWLLPQTQMNAERKAWTTNRTTALPVHPRLSAVCDGKFVFASLRGEPKPLSTLAPSAGGQDGTERNTDTWQINESSRQETTWPRRKTLNISVGQAAPFLLRSELIFTSAKELVPCEQWCV